MDLKSSTKFCAQTAFTRAFWVTIQRTGFRALPATCIGFYPRGKRPGEEFAGKTFMILWRFLYIVSKFWKLCIYIKPFQNLTIFFKSTCGAGFGFLLDPMGCVFLLWDWNKFVLITDMGFWNLTALSGQPFLVWKIFFDWESCATAQMKALVILNNFHKSMQALKQMFDPVKPK